MQYNICGDSIRGILYLQCTILLVVLSVGLCFLGTLKSYFSAPKRKNLVFFCRCHLFMVFGGQITFSTPKKTFQNIFRPPKFFSAPQIFFCLRVFARGIVKCARQGPRKMKTPPSPHICSNIEGGGGGGGGGGGRGVGDPTKKKNQPHSTKNGLKKNPAWAGDQSAAFFLSALRKTAIFRRPKPKIGFFGGRRRSKGLVVGVLNKVVHG